MSAQDVIKDGQNDINRNILSTDDIMSKSGELDYRDKLITISISATIKNTLKKHHTRSIIMILVKYCQKLGDEGNDR